MDKFYSNKEEFTRSLERVLDTLGMPSERVHILSTAFYQTQGLQELYDAVSYSSYINAREMFPVTAELKDSLLKWTKVTNSQFQNVIPATRWFNLAMDIEDVLRESTQVSDKIFRYTIPKSTVIYLEDFPYSLDYDIVIQIYDPKGKVSVTAKYDMSGEKNPISNVVNPNVKAIKHSKQLILSLLLSQYKREYNSYRYIDISTDIHTITYKDQLVDFDVYYRVTEYSEEITKLQKSLSIQRGIPDEPTIYYSLNEQKIILTNRGYRGNFLPARDSSIELTMYISKGSQANFKYLGNKIKIKDDEDNELPFFIDITTDEEVALNGVSEDSIDALRKKVVNDIHKRDSLISEYDLNLHYSSRNGVYKVIKSRDDWKIRVYSIFTSLYDKDKYLVPTNTLNLSCDLSQLTNSTDFYMVPEKSKFFLEEAGETAVLKSEADDNDKFTYTLPLSLVLNKPHRIIEAYELEINRTKATSFEYLFDRSAYSFMVNRAKITRSAGEDIKISFNIMTNLIGDTKVIFHKDEDGKIVDTGQLFICVSFASTNGVYKGYVEAKMKSYNEENDMYEYEASIKTDYFIKKDVVNLQLKTIERDRLENTECPIKFNSIKIVVQDNGTNEDVNANKYGVPSKAGKGLINVFSLDDIELIKSYTDTAGIQLKDNSKTGVTFLQVPVLGYDYVDAHGFNIANLAYSELEHVEALWLQTQTNFVNNLKFINTYGPSRNYIIGNGVDKLDTVQLSMKFKVGLVYNATVDFDYVRDFIVSKFKEVDFLNDDDFHVSDIIRDVRDKIPDVTKIEFVSINNYNSDYQYIHSNYDIDDPTIIPEIVNISYDNNKNFNIILQKI